jgi:hypothetical protein
LPTILREYDKVARQCARKDGLPAVLTSPAELELLDRDREPGAPHPPSPIPVVKSLDSFDFAIPSLNKTLVLELAR